MKILKTLIVGILLIVASALVHPANAQQSMPEITKIPQRDVLNSVPLSFESNFGQTGAAVNFLARGDGYALFLTPSQIVFKLRTTSAMQSEPSVLRMQLINANYDAQISGAEKLSTTVNYFIGRDSSKWLSGIPTYGKVNYRGIYPGVDAVFYGNQRELEYDFMVGPGADPKQIVLAFSGAQPQFDHDGNVILAMDGDNVMLHKPHLYQGEGARRKPIDGSYIVAGNRVHFRIGAYDRSQPLVIDPVISYLTYLGGKTGTGSNGNVAVTSISCRPSACVNGAAEGQGLAVDSTGNVYVTGETYAVDFPTQDPFQATNKSATQWTAYVTKLNPMGTGLVYSTYLGGTGNDEADAIAIDASGSAYVIGLTYSGDFPTTPGSYVSNCPIQGGTTTYCQSNGAGFLTKLSPDGQSLLYSTYIPIANLAMIHAVAVDSKGRAYISGDNVTYGNSNSTSPSLILFPTTANALMPSSLVDQAVHPGVGNPGMAFVTVFSGDGSSLVYSTLFGDSNPVAHVNNGAGYTRATGVAVDPAGNFYLTGYTQDPYLPVTANAFQTVYSAFSGAYRGYVAKFTSIDSTNGPQLVYATYLGATNTTINVGDEITGITADATGNAYVTGLTQSPDFPTTPGSYSPGPCAALTTYCNRFGFLTKIKPDGTGLAWSTYVGYTGSSYFGVQAILPPRLDAKGNVYVEVQSGIGYPVLNPVQTPQGNAVLGITKFNPTGSKLFFSTLLGSPTGLSQYGGSQQYPAGLDVDPQGNIYVGGMTDGGDLPTTAGAFQMTFPLTSQNYSAFLAKIYPFLDTNIGLAVAPNSVNVGQTVVFTATVGTNQKGTATGTVNFMNGATQLGTGLLNANGVATMSSNTLPAGVYSVTAQYLGDDTFGASTSSAQSLTILGVSPQTITFAALPNAPYGVAPITLGATASSGLPVSYTVTGPAVLNGAVLTVIGTGYVSVTASQAGDANYSAAAPVTQSFTVSPAVITVTASSVTITYGQAIPALTYAMTGFVNSDPTTVVTGTPLETTTATSTSAPGTYPIAITQGTLAAANYTFTFVNGTLTIAGGALQTITFAALPNVIYGAGPITLAATASSGLQVTYAVTGPATLAGSVLTVTGTGTVSVTASQAGNGNYAAATPVTRSFSVAPAALTITAANATITYGQAIPAFTYTATGFVNGDTSAVLAGTPLETTTATSTSAPGTYSITITQGTLAAANYTFTFVNGTLTIAGGASQTIAFAALPNVTYGVSPVTLSATASSGLPVTYTVTGPATLASSVLSTTGFGTVSVTASQAGNSTYAAATPVTRSFTVARATLTITANNASMMYGQAIPSFTYAATGFVNGDTSGTLSGTPLETTTATSTSAPGTYPITITQGTLTAANYVFAFVNGTLAISAATQTITFSALAAQSVGATVALNASASSGLQVTFTTLTPTVCTVAGSTAQTLIAGTCSIQASEAGNADYLAATPVTQSFSVGATGAGFTITPKPQTQIVDCDDDAVFLLNLSSVNGFKGKVRLTCSGGPAGSRCADMPQTVYLNGRGYAFTWIGVPKNTAPGSYTVTFTGTSGSTTVSAEAQLIVKPKR